MDNARLWRSPSRRTTLVVAVAYIVLRIGTWVLSLPTILGPDSHSFLPGPGLTGAPIWYVGFEKVSFTGDGAIRPWTVSLPYALLLTDYFRSFAQMLLSVGAFLYLAASVRRLTTNRNLGSTLALIVLVFSLATLVTGWDMLLNRESAAISLTALFVAAVLNAGFHADFRKTAVVVLVGFLALVTRPTLAPLILPLATVILMLHGRRLPPSTHGRAARGVNLLLSVVTLAVLTVYPIWYTARLDASWEKWYGQTHSETQFGYVVSDYNPRAGALRDALRPAAPACLVDAIPVYTGEYVGAPWGFAAHLRDTCPEFKSWYAESWPGWYYRYVATQPTYVLKLGMSGLPLALHPWDTTRATSVLPLPARDVFYPAVAGDEQLGKYEPLYLYWGVVAVLVLAALVTRRDWLLRRHRKLATIIGLMVVGSLASIVVNLVLIPSYPLETNRLNVSTALLLRLLGPLLAVALTWSFVRQRRGRQGSL